MNLNCVIIDDEPLAINVIKNYINQTNGITCIASFNSAIESIDYLANQKVDVLFLDINMPVLDGLNFIKSLPHKPLTIITTAYEEYAVESYELDVLDYLVKPIPYTRFIMAINKALKNVGDAEKGKNVNDREHLFVKIDNKKMKKIYFDEVLTIESLKDYIKINTISDKYIVRQSLSSFTEQLPSPQFIRIHRSYTIATNQVETIEGNSVEIAGIRYPIGRSYVANVKGVLLNEYDTEL